MSRPLTGGALATRLGLADAPVPALWLGFGGLAPFALAAIWRLIPDAPMAELARVSLGAYGAVILSFLGGVRWGLAMGGPAPLWGPLGASVLPALLGWVALLLPAGPGLALLALGFMVLLVADRRLDQAPAWYRALRVPLTLGAVSALLIGFAS